MSIRLIVSDIDGTLLNSAGFVSQRNTSALQEAESSGAQIALATGNSHSFALQIANMLGMTTHIISSNGALVQVANSVVFHRKLLEPQVAQDILAMMRHPNIRATITSDQWSLPLSDPDRAQLGMKNILQLTFCGSRSDILRAVDHMRSRGMNKDVSISAVLDTTQEFVVDIGPAEATKGSALEFLCCRLGLRRDHVLAIGNAENDCGMLEFAGHAFLVANAPEQLKTRNWKIAPSNDQDGVAWAIRSLRQPSPVIAPTGSS